MAEFYAMSRAVAHEMQKTPGVCGLFYDVSSRGAYGALFSPFCRGNSPIPVPGTDKVSLTVEGIWQGLKIIDGKIDEALFTEHRVKKRKHTDYAATQFRYGTCTIDIVQARKHIYIPSYWFHVDNCVPQQFTDNMLRAGIAQYYYDVDSNFDITDISSSYSHSDALIKWLHRQIDIQPKQRALLREAKCLDIECGLPPRVRVLISMAADAFAKNIGTRSELCDLVTRYVRASGYTASGDIEALLGQVSGAKDGKQMILSALRIDAESI